MKFITLIIAVSYLQFRGSAQAFHRDHWYDLLRDKLTFPALGGYLAILLVVLLPVAALVLALNLTGDALLGLPLLVINVLVLLYAFGRGDFDGMVKHYQQCCRAGDFEAAYLFIRDRMGAEVEDCSNEAEAMHRWFKAHMAYQGFERWFAVIFWFAIFGAPGALAYRLLQCYRASADTVAARERLLYLVDWLPSRLLIFAFAVTGDWVASRDQLATALRDGEHPTPAVLADAAHASLGLKTTVFANDSDVESIAQVSDWEIQQIRELLGRSAMAWLVVLSLFVLIT